jgi:hypothetical protein
MQRLTRYIIILLVSLLAASRIAHAQLLILNPSEGAATPLHHVAVTVIGKPGALATLFVNNSPADTGRIRIDGQYDFLNIEVPDGPVYLRVEAEGAANQHFTATRTIHVLGMAQNIMPYEKDIRLVADGKSLRNIQLEVQDEWGYPLPHLKLATVRLSTGKLTNPDLDPQNPGTQIAIQNGVINLELQSPTQVGEALLEVEVDNAYVQLPIEYNTATEPFILVGSIEGALAKYRDFGSSANEPDPEIWRRNQSKLAGQEFLYGGRAALYAKGSIARNYRLTVSYDSDRDYQDQFFEDIDPDEQYPLYGDASTVTYDAQTRSQLFVKLERNQSFISYGDYNTAFDQAEFSAYNRTLNGLISNLHHKRHNLKAFAALTDHQMTLDEIRGEGLSGYYFLSRSNISRYSEKIWIQVRDRYHPETVIKSRALARFQDYDIDYIDGTLMFKQPVASIDENSNPVFIVASYESRSGRPESALGGFQYTGILFGKLQLGSTYVFEEQGESTTHLYGFSAKLPLFKWLAVGGEFAGSSVPEDHSHRKEGTAYKIEANFNPVKFFNLKGYYRHVDSSFVNPSLTGADFEMGSEKYGAKATLQSEKFGALSGEYYNQNNQIGTINENRAEVFSLMYERKFSERGQVNLGYENALRKRRQSASDSFAKTEAELLRAQLSYRLTPKLTSLLEHDQNLAGEIQAKPTATGIGLRYDLTRKVSVFAKYRLLQKEGNRDQAVLGFDSRVTENTELVGKYEIGGALGDQRNRASIGLKNKWQVTSALTLNLAYENVATLDDFEVPTSEHQSGSVAFEYLPERPWKTTGKYEYSTDRSTNKHVGTFGTDVKILYGLSGIAKLKYFRTEFRKENNHHLKTDLQLGLAYRPERSDYYNAVVKAAYIIDHNTHVQPTSRLDRFVVAVNQYWQPLSWLELGSRIARRIIVDAEGEYYNDQVTTDFISLRTEIDLSLKWSTALDWRCIRLQPLDEQKQGLALELSYLLLKNLQVGVGYSLKTFEDPDFAAEHYEFNNFYLTLHMKFSENLFDWR